MQRDFIEDMVVKEFKGLCSTCAHVHSCAYSEKRSDKVIIQCEMFEVDYDNRSVENTPSGRPRDDLPITREKNWNMAL